MKKYISFLILILVFNLFGQNNEIFTQADNFRLNGDYQKELSELKKLLKNDEQSTQILWRIAQAYFDIGDQSEDKKIHKENFYPGFDAAKKAIALNPNNARANHWYATLIGKIGILEGTKQKITNSYEVKIYALKAIALDNNYDGTHHLMGRWHYEIASLSWAEKKIAGLIYSTLPEASLTEATGYFKKASMINPDEIRHQFWLGKTYLKMKETSKAAEAFRKVSSMKAYDNSDSNMQKEAKKLLIKLK